jgi:nuclear transport factor 2 (NTF2) superfamily protein
MATRFQYEWRNADGQWFRSYGNELWEFDVDGLVCRYEASSSNLPISEADRRFFGFRPKGERGAGHDIPLG